MATVGDVGDRQFHRDDPDQLWVTDMTEHPMREGKVYCAVVLDVFSRRVVRRFYRTQRRQPRLRRTPSGC